MMEHKNKVREQTIPEIADTRELEALGVGVSILNTDFRVMYQNTAHKKLYGDCIGGFCYKAYEMKDSVCKNCPAVMVLKDGQTHQQIKTKLTEKGFEHMEITVSPMRDSTGKTIAFIEVAIDITARRKSEIALKESEERYRALVESTDDSIYLVDRNCQYIFVNKKHLSRLGISVKQSRGYSFSDFHSPEETKLFEEKIQTTFRTNKSAQYEYKSLRDERYFLQTFSPVYNSQGEIEAVTIVSKDITRRKEMEEKLRRLSLSDELTGIYNRRGFFAMAEQQLKFANRKKRGIFIICVDLDFLKVINDNLGHQTGDTALIETAKVLKKSFRESDIVARVGGDEFVVLAQETSETNLELITTRLRGNLNAHNSVKKRPFELSLSMGITRYDPNHPCSIDDLISRADKLMYEEKKQKHK
ncbi:MAG: diguanylate cyclase [Nitrospiraceae bacterium]|nr:MAG: diguanylate cyclase [Nitrospiraceae bacterium]